jgi:CBS domain-containing protein
VYATPERGGEARAEGYFATLAARVCEALTQSGYRDCKGLVMASNPKWRQPADVWKGYFTNWISKAEEKELMEFGTFFDLRCVMGEEGLIQALRAHTQKEMAQSPLFYPQAARTALLFKSPLRLFGTIVPTGGPKEKSGQLDLKTVMMPIVSFARLYSLQRNIAVTSTQERLSALSDLGVLLPSQHHDLVTAFETLLRFRLRHQALTIQNGDEPDNLIDPSRLGHIDEAVLKECFKEIDRIQERISRDFLGGETRL